jgi:Protein of unknown function (DUF1064)
MRTKETRGVVLKAMNWTQANLAGRRSEERTKQGRVRNVAPKAARTFNGTAYHSKTEAEYALYFSSLGLSKKIKSVKEQVVFPMEVNGKLICKMVVDFEIEHLDGRLELVEIKGWETPEYKIKHKLFKALYPDRLYTVVKV